MRTVRPALYCPRLLVLLPSAAPAGGHRSNPIKTAAGNAAFATINHNQVWDNRIGIVSDGSRAAGGTIHTFVRDTVSSGNNANGIVVNAGRRPRL